MLLLKLNLKDVNTVTKFQPPNNMSYTVTCVFFLFSNTDRGLTPILLYAIYTHIPSQLTLWDMYYPLYEANKTLELPFFLITRDIN